MNELLPSRNKLFLSGPFGSGKTTDAIERIRWLLQQERIRGDDILVLVPQRTLGRPYTQALRQANIPPGPPVRVTTFAGLARNAVELYWPLLAPEAGFADPDREPTFLNLETAQYHMADFVEAAFQQAEFDAIRVEPSRVVSQVLDNLNKAALHDFSIDEAYQRLELAVPQGEQHTARLNVLRAAARISRAFRALCLQESLVDFSLWIQLFSEHVLTNQWSRTHLFRAHRHLIMDNAEEDTFAAHNLVRQWLPHLESALIVSDDDGGYRLFLGADPQDAATLADDCDTHLRLTDSHIMPPALHRMARRIDRAIQGGRPETAPEEGPELPITFQPHRFYPQMIDWVVAEIQQLVEEKGVQPGQIAVLAPFVSDALRFSLQTGLDGLDIPSTSHRPSRALNAEPAARALLTLADLAHPHWQRYPSPADITLTLGVAIEQLDPVRAHLFSRVVYGVRGQQSGELQPFATLKTAVQQRITFGAGEAYDRLRHWLYAYRAETEFTPLDQFFARIFGEVLSQPGYGFHDDLDTARIANQLVESARNFRWAVADENLTDADDRQEAAQSSNERGRRTPTTIGRDYVELVESGALGALYVPGWREDEEAVFIAPAYTYLMRNRPVDVQFWLDIGASGWWERLYQPLTHPYVLSQQWPTGTVWTDLDEYRKRQDTLRRLLLGLVRRTRRAIYLGMSDYGEGGMEQRGPLLNLLNKILLEEQRQPIPLP